MHIVDRVENQHVKKMKLCHFVVRLFFETTNQIDDWEKDMEKQNEPTTLGGWKPQTLRDVWGVLGRCSISSAAKPLSGRSSASACAVHQGMGWKLHTSHGFATLPVIHQDTGPRTIIHHPMVRNTEPSPRLSPCQCPPTRKVLLGAMLMVLRMAVLGSSNADALQHHAVYVT